MRLTKEEFDQSVRAAEANESTGYDLFKMSLDLRDAIEALKEASLVLSGADLNKGSLTRALEKARSVLTFPNTKKRKKS